MFYREYKQKVLSVGRIFENIRRFRILILCIILAVAALIISLISITGIFYSSSACPEEITYGQSLNYKAKAIFKKTHNEYCREGSDEWTEVQPRLVGSYKVRAVTKDAFGNVKYGEVYSYEILPAATDVNFAQPYTVYGDGIELSANLAYSDAVNLEAFEYTEDGGGGYSVFLTRENITVTDPDGNDVTACYKLNVIEQAISVMPRSVTLTVESAEKVYDGTPLTVSSYEITDGSPADGDSITAKFATERTEAGQSVSVPEITVSDSDGKDVTRFYDFEIIGGIIQIDRRELAISSCGAEKIYDGKPLYNTEYSLETGSCAEGQRLELSYYPQITDAGYILNELEFAVLDSRGRDVTYNYEISCLADYLTVYRRTIDFTTADHQWLYDGYAHYDDAYSISGEGIVDGQSYYLTEFPSVLYAGTTINSVSIEILDEYGNSVTDDYEVVYSYGSLTVNKRKLTVTTGGGEWKYDGYEHANSNYSLTGDGFADGESAYLTDFTTIKDVSTKQNVLKISVCDYREYLTVNNYDITYVYGMLTVTPRIITVSTYDETFVYNGEEQFNSYYNIGGDGLADNQYPYSDNYAVIKDVGTAENVVTIVIKDYDGTECTGNYEITYIYGQLKVEPRPITVYSASAEKVYDGMPLTNSRCYADNIVSFHTLKSVLGGSQTEVGTSLNYFNSIKILDENGANVAYNYDINFIEGTLTVTPRCITVTAGSASKLYDRTPLTCSDYTAIYLVGGHSLSANTVGSQTRIGSSVNVVDQSSVVIYDFYGNDVTSNYSALYISGKLTVYGSQKYDEEINLTYDDADKTINIDLGDTSISYEDILIFINSDGYVVSWTNDGSGKVNVDGLGSGEYTIILTDSDGVFLGELEFEISYSDFGYGGDMDESGNIGLAGSMGQGGNSIVMTVYSDVGGTVYLRYKSFGDYYGQGWTSAEEYGYLILDEYSYNYLTSVALDGNGYLSHDIVITNYSSQYYLPTYMAMGDYYYDVQHSDVVYSGDTDNVYILKYYSYDYIANGALDGVTGKYADLELDYRDFVYSRYLSVPQTTVDYLNYVIAEQGFDLNDPDCIAKIAEYIKNSANYNLEYDRSLDDEEDIVLAFLTEYKEGICQHYASAATLLYRAMGIPARYVTGYAGYTIAGQTVDITSDSAHAWVEIYIDGVGWVQVEVTGSVKEADTDIEITLYEISKYYDGTPIYYEEDDYYVSKIPDGLRVEFSLSGELTDAGVYSLELLENLPLTVYDAYGNDVTDRYTVSFKGTPLTVLRSLLEITFVSGEENDDGTYTDGTAWISLGKLVDGHRVVYDYAEDGLLENVTVYDSNGRDVSSNYNIVIRDEASV